MQLILVFHAAHFEGLFVEGRKTDRVDMAGQGGIHAGIENF